MPNLLSTLIYNPFKSNYTTSFGRLHLDNPFKSNYATNLLSTFIILLSSIVRRTLAGFIRGDTENAGTRTVAGKAMRFETTQCSLGYRALQLSVGQCSFEWGSELCVLQYSYECGSVAMSVTVLLLRVWLYGCCESLTLSVTGVQSLARARSTPNSPVATAGYNAY
jgi:hypothetical protein